MKKNTQIIQDILKKNEFGENFQFPKIFPTIKFKKNSEVFSCYYSGGVIHLEAESEMAAVFGLNHLNMGLTSQHLPEFLGDWKPEFGLRPLWIGSNISIPISQNISIIIPDVFACEDEQKWEFFCRRVLELGYNSVIFGGFDIPSSRLYPAERNINLENICSFFHQFDLKIILKPNKPVGRCPWDTNQAEAIENDVLDIILKAPSLDYLFWQGDFLHPNCYSHPLSKESTQLEMVELEVGLLEKALQNKVSLIYYVESPDLQSAQKQVTWLPNLCDSVGNQTIIAFSALAGAPWQDHLAPHPFWETLRSSPDASSTGLLPIINSGGVNQGEGLWPSLSFDITEQFVSRCERHHFAGVVSLVNQIPQKGGLLDCNLWVNGQMLWKKRSPYRLAETWFASQRPDFNYAKFSSSLNQIRKLIVELSWIRSLRNEKHRDILSNTECKALADSYLASLRQLQTFFESEEKKSFKKSLLPSCSDYFQYFAQDARRIVAHFMQCFQVSLPYLRKEEDDMEGFWTNVKPVGTMSPSSILLESPQRGLPGTRMEQIFFESGKGD